MQGLLRRLSKVALMVAVLIAVPAITTTTVAQALPAPDPPAVRSLFTPVVPARLLDTRPGETTIDGLGRPGAPLSKASSISLQVLGRGGVPATGVSAVALNITATNATATTFVTVSPTGPARPHASNLNVVVGATVPNLVIVKVGTDGKVDLYNNAGKLDLIADIAGYVPSTDSYVPLVPQRLLDTRPGEMTIDGLSGKREKIRANSSIDLTVVGRAGVPLTNVDSVVLNVTATNPTADSYLTVFPKGSKQPTASNLNMIAGATIPNLVIAKVGQIGAITIYNHSGSTDVLADIAGYFPVGGTFVSVIPARIFETRPTESVIPEGTNRGYQLYDQTSVDVNVSGIAGVPPDSIAAVVLNVTAVGSSGNTFLTVYPTGSERPLASNLNVRAGGPPVPNLVVSKVGAGGNVTIYNNRGRTDVIVDIAGYFLTEYGGVRDIDLSDNSTCLLDVVGSVSCWGNTPQDPGSAYSPNQIRSDPYDLNTFDDVVDVAVDLAHTCVLRSDGSVWCWTSGNFYGTAGPTSPKFGMWPAQKIPLSGRVVEIDDGELQTCALLDDSTVWCWGKDFTNAARPNPWKVENLSNVVQVDVGDYHGCALRESGDVRCWGIFNQYGSLGNGSGVDSPKTAVTVSGLSDADSISTQSLRTCATRVTGDAKCWGLTTGPTGFTLTPVDVMARTNGIDAPANDIWQMDGGDDYVCALRFDDNVYCYGSEFQQNAGLGGPVGGPPDIFTDPVPGLPPIAFINADRFHMCAVSYDDEVFCWGFNGNGQVGDGTTVSATAPELIVTYS